MAQKKHDTFLIHLNHERMFTTVSPEQCKRLVTAMFKLARTGELEDMSDDLVLDIFWEQISSFVASNERYYTDACNKKAEAQKNRWEEYRRLKAEEAKRNGQIPDDDIAGGEEELPFGDNM